MQYHLTIADSHILEGYFNSSKYKFNLFADDNLITEQVINNEDFRVSLIERKMNESLLSSPLFSLLGKLINKELFEEKMHFLLRISGKNKMNHFFDKLILLNLYRNVDKYMFIDGFGYLKVRSEIPSPNIKTSVSTLNDWDMDAAGKLSFFSDKLVYLKLLYESDVSEQILSAEAHKIMRYFFNDASFNLGSKYKKHVRFPKKLIEIMKSLFVRYFTGEEHEIFGQLLEKIN